jgi:hypothetical protein
MDEQPATNPNRPPLYNVGAGNVLRGSQVEILGTPENKPLVGLKPTDRVAVREYTDFSGREQQLREAAVLWRNLARAYRTKEDEQLGRDFTDEEAANYGRQIRLRAAEHQAGYRREQILGKLESIATSLERAAEDVRRAAQQSEHYGLASSVQRVQHDLVWLFPNLGVDSLTTDVVGWLQMEAETKRFGDSSEEATEA